METENAMAFVVRQPLWRRFVDRILNQPPPDESWYDVHDKVPKGGDLLTNITEVTFGWQGILRLICLRRISVEVRIITKEPVNVVEQRAHTRIG